MINQKLKAELKDATQQLIVKSNELTSSKTELQRHRQEIDVSFFTAINVMHCNVIYYLPHFLILQRLNQDICNLSTLCASAEKNEKKKIDKDEILAALRAWQESGNLPEDVEIVSHVVNACNEVKATQTLSKCHFKPFLFILKDSHIKGETS